MSRRLRYSTPPNMSIRTLSRADAQKIAKAKADRAIETGDLDVIFGNNGRTGRKASGNYTLLAVATGMTRVHIGKVLRGLCGASHELLDDLSRVTGISMDEISEYIKAKQAGRRAA
jgi:hypothetical protein